MFSAAAPVADDPPVTPHGAIVTICSTTPGVICSCALFFAPYLSMTSSAPVKGPAAKAPCAH
jgi:hypothetical protein